MILTALALVPGDAPTITEMPNKLDLGRDQNFVVQGQGSANFPNQAR